MFSWFVPASTHCNRIADVANFPPLAHTWHTSIGLEWWLNFYADGRALLRSIWPWFPKREKKGPRHMPEFWQEIHLRGSVRCTLSCIKSDRNARRPCDHWLIRNLGISGPWPAANVKCLEIDQIADPYPSKISDASTVGSVDSLQIDPISCDILKATSFLRLIRTRKNRFDSWTKSCFTWGRWPIPNNNPPSMLFSM